MKTVFAVAILTSICLISQNASAFVWVPNTAFVTLSGCDAGYLEDCNNKRTIHKTKSYTINLQESLNMDTNDKQPSEKKTVKLKPTKKLDTDKKKSVKKEKTKLEDDLNKKFDQIKKKSTKPITKNNTQTT